MLFGHFASQLVRNGQNFRNKCHSVALNAVVNFGRENICSKTRKGKQSKDRDYKTLIVKSLIGCNSILLRKHALIVLCDGFVNLPKVTDCTVQSWKLASRIKSRFFDRPVGKAG